MLFKSPWGKFLVTSHPFLAVSLGRQPASIITVGALGLRSRFDMFRTNLHMLFKSLGEVFGHFPPIPCRVSWKATSEYYYSRGTWFPTWKSGRWLKNVPRVRLYGAGHLGHSSQWPSRHVLKVLATTCHEGYLARRDTTYIEFVRSYVNAMGLGTLPGGGTLVPVHRLGSARPPNT
jgi:hypothetical protein